MPADAPTSTSSAAPPQAPPRTSPKDVHDLLGVPTQPALPPHSAETLTEARTITSTHAEQLRDLLSTYLRRHLPERSPARTEAREPPRMVGAHAKALPFLRAVPWVLGALFGLSFAWDFPGVTADLFGRTLVLEGLLRILAVSGLIGFITNWLAITMLFQPREERPLVGQGLIPAQRERVIFRLAKAVSEELINEEIIKRKIEESGVIPRYREMALSVTRGVLEDPAFRTEVKALTASYVEQVLGSKEVRQRIVDFTIEKVEEHAGQGLSGLALKVYRFVNEDDFQQRIDRAVQQLPDALDDAMDQIDHLLDRVPEKIEARSDDIEAWATRVVLGFVENLDVYNMIMDNMRQYDEQQLERLLKTTSNEQLNYIKYLGGLLGFVGGLVIWEPLLSLTVFGTLGLILYAIDETLFRLRRETDA
ncbi:MAG: DUF445 family protein [Bacteroidetes bacterium]|nr:DUF445 family protein [Bacteroidota bacterium]